MVFVSLCIHKLYIYNNKCVLHNTYMKMTKFMLPSLYHAARYVDTSKKLSSTVTLDTTKVQINFYFIILSIIFTSITIFLSFLSYSPFYICLFVILYVIKFLAYRQFNKDINKTQKPLADMAATSELLRFRLPGTTLKIRINSINCYNFVHNILEF